MAENSSSSPNLTPDALNRSQSNLSVKSSGTTTSRLSTTSTLFSSSISRKRHGFIGKIGNGFQSIFRRFSRPHTSLTEIDVKILQTQTNFTREEIEQWHEKFLKECPNGYMTRKQFIAQYKYLCPKVDADRYARHLFRALDLDKSKTIDFREFLLSASMTSPTSSIEMKLQWIFYVFDIDGNGLLTRRECLEVIESIVRFRYSGLNEHSNTHLHDVLLAAKRSMMKIFDSYNDLHVDGLTMSQFVQSCLKDDFIIQLLAATPTDTSSLSNSSDG